MNFKTKRLTLFLKRGFFLIGVLTFSGCLGSIMGGGQKKVVVPPDGGVYRSDDSGETFVQKSKIDEETNLGQEDLLSLVFDPQDTRILYAGTNRKGLVKSKDKGENWELSGGGFTNVKDIFVSHKNQKVIFLIATVEGVTKLLRTDDGGENWLQLSKERIASERLTAFNVDRENEQIIYLGDARGGIQKTENGGKTWKNILWAKSGIREMTPDPVDVDKFYIVTSATGIMRTDDGGDSFVTLPISGTILNFITHPIKEGVVYVSTNKGMGISNDGGVSWKMINTLIRPSEIGSRGLAIDPQNDNILYFVSGNSLYKTIDKGQTWKAIDLGTLGRNRWIVLMRVDPIEPNVLYFGTKLPPPPPKNNNSLFLM